MQVWGSDPPSSRFKGKFINRVEANHNDLRFSTAVMYGITVQCVCTKLIYSVCGPG